MRARWMQTGSECCDSPPVTTRLAPGDALRVLLIEDDDAYARLIGEWLQRADRPVSRLTRAATLSEGLALLTAAPCDAVLLDLCLPDSSGVATVASVRAVDPDVPIVVLSGMTDSCFVYEALRAGADDYLLKEQWVQVLLPRALHYLHEARRAERLQREYDALQHLLLNVTDAALMLVDQDGALLAMNDVTARRLGRPAEELVGQNILAFLPPAVARACQAHASEAARAGEPLTREDCHAGEWVEVSYYPLPARDGTEARLVVTARTITDRKLAEQALRDMPRRITQAQEDERRRIARELHDGVSQILASARFRLKGAEEALHARRRTAPPDFARAGELLDASIREVQRVSHSLRPSELDDLGLLSAIRSLCAGLADRLPLRLYLPRTVPPLRQDADLALYRILQEALRNVEKHAQASRVTVRLAGDANGSRLTVKDNGRGFDPAAAAGHGLGLANMRDRIAMLDGRLTLKTAPGQGTVVEAVIPPPPRNPPNGVGTS